MVNEKMTVLASEIRELSDTITPKSIDAMISDVSIANIEITKQADLIEQITAALEGKTGETDEDGAEVCTVLRTPTLGLLRLIYHSPDGLLHHYDDTQGLGIVEFPVNFKVNKNSLVIIETDIPKVTTVGANILATIDSRNFTQLHLIQIIESSVIIDGFDGL